MNKLDRQDLAWAVRRLPKKLKAIMQEHSWIGKIYVGGGFLRASIAREEINDVDVFVQSKHDAELLANKLTDKKEDIHKTDNAYTIKGKLPIQIIDRWLFTKPEDVANSFDFTIACAVIYFHEAITIHGLHQLDETKHILKWGSYIDERFYVDLAAKRLTYRNPVRNEDAGGSLLRVLKFYQKGYRIPLDSMGMVIARTMSAVNLDSISGGLSEVEVIGKIVTGLLREVDPSIDPTHEAHMTSSTDIKI